MRTRGKWPAILACAGALLIGTATGCASPGARPALEPEWDAPVAPLAAPTKPAPSAPAVKKPAVKKPVVKKPVVKAASLGKKTQVKATPRFSGPADSQMRTRGDAVALTFDDGPDPVQTPRILDLLAQNHVTATFCLIGLNVQAHPDLVRRIVAEGHTLCNHTWRHSLTIGKQSTAAIRADLRRTNDAIHDAAPGAPIRYTRAPGGDFTPAYVTVASGLGMTSLYWQVDPRDWEHRAGETPATHRGRVIAAVKTHVRKGSIVLSHDAGQPDTIAAYRTLLPWLKQRYQLTRLP
jgi:peptidoglycan-N-acetylglucosamine deacetylase